MESRATVKVAAVFINVIRIGRHKMTLSVFKQIQTEIKTPVMPDDILGWVNHDGCWVLWTENDELRRRRLFCEDPDKIGNMYACTLAGTHFFNKNDAGMRWIREHKAEVKRKYPQLFIAV